MRGCIIGNQEVVGSQESELDLEFKNIIASEKVTFDRESLEKLYFLLINLDTYFGVIENEPGNTKVKNTLKMINDFVDNPSLVLKLKIKFAVNNLAKTVARQNPKTSTWLRIWLSLSFGK